MRIPVYDKSGKKKKDANVPDQFKSSVRKDMIKKAVTAIWKNKTQPHGTKERAGMTSSAVFRGIRRGYGRSYNWGISRLPRLMVRGGRRVGRVVNVPQAKGGPKAHPPKSEKKKRVKLNKKERKMAIRSAIAATLDREMVAERGHKVPKKYPFALSDDFEDIDKTADVKKLLVKMGLEEELKRVSKRKTRAGKGKRRGRKYKTKTGPLIVVSDAGKPVFKAASNIAGVDVVAASSLNAEVLAPGAHPGRLTLFTDPAMKEIKHRELFL